MSFGFVFILPFVLGIITVYFAAEKNQRSWLFALFAPWATAAICLFTAALLGWEGAICLIMGFVIYAPLASCGGICTCLILRWKRPAKLNAVAIVPFLFIPPITTFVEGYFDIPVSYHEVHTEITIHASPEKIWSEIIRVRPITEPITGFFYRMGFPKPIEATLSHEGIGGVRMASFERGLVFVETVTDWEPEKLLSFGIKVDPNSVPTTTLDKHVVVGGRYFDVLRGTYSIEPKSDGTSVLHLSSRFRVSTNFNFYAGPWARFLMGDIQNSILQVIRERCEERA